MDQMDPMKKIFPKIWRKILLKLKYLPIILQKKSTKLRNRLNQKVMR
jgi:hypothetical protein